MASELNNIEATINEAFASDRNGDFIGLEGVIAYLVFHKLIELINEPTHIH